MANKRHSNQAHFMYVKFFYISHIGMAARHYGYSQRKAGLLYGSICIEPNQKRPWHTLGNALVEPTKHHGKTNKNDHGKSR